MYGAAVILEMKHLIVIAWLLCCCSATAQQFRCEKLPTQSQLPVANVHRIMQDSEGYMWYATEGGGLCRDDGYKISVFRNDRNHPDLLASNDITCIAEDAQGHIWFGTTKGGYILDKQDYKIRPLKVIDGKGVSYIFRRFNGEMLVAVVGNIYHFSPDQKLLHTYTTAPGRNDAWANSFVEDKEHHLFVNVVNDDIYCLDESSNSLKSLNWPYNKSSNYLAADTVNGGLWIGTWGLGVVRYKKDFKRMFQTMGDEGADTFQSQVLNVVIDQHRHLLWVTTMEDIYAYRIEADSLQTLNIAPILPQGKKIIDNAVLDRHGNLWVPGYSPHTFIITSSDGQIRRDAVTPMSDKTGYRVMVDRICHADGDYYWIWQGRTLLSLYNAATNELSFANEQIIAPPFNTSKCLTASADGRSVWSADGKDILRVWHEGMTIRHEIFATATDQVTCICDAGDALWVGLSDGIALFDKKTRNGKVLVQKIGTVRKIVKSSVEIAFFVSAKRGFCAINTDGNLKELQTDGDFTSVAISSDNVVWAATSGGSVFYANPASKLAGFKAELSKTATNGNGDSVKDLVFDARGHLWILSDQYLKEFNPANEASRVIRNTDKDVDMDYFHTLQLDGDSILLGGIGAFCAIAPSEQLETANTDVRPRVTTFFLDGIEYFCGSDLVKIPKTTREAVLCVSTFDPLHAAQLRISYRLSSSEEWTDLEPGQNRIYLRTLDSGDYTLEVRATDEYGRWTDGVECLTVRQMEDWWRMPWVRWLFILIVLPLLAYVVYRYRQRLAKISKLLLPRRLSLGFSSKEDLEKLREKQQTKQQADAEFVEQVRQQVKDHLDNSDFGVEELSASMFMSRMNLYRRLQAATGVTPNEFIRTVRLESAAEMLLTTQLPVSEVSDRTGFGTPRYFTRCFKEKYGVLPKDFRSQQVS